MQTHDLGRLDSSCNIPKVLLAPDVNSEPVAERERDGESARFPSGLLASPL